MGFTCRHSALSSAGRLHSKNVTTTFDLFDPKPNQFIIVSDAPMTKVWRKSVNGYWRYRGNIKHTVPAGRTHALTDARTEARTQPYKDLTKSLPITEYRKINSMYKCIMVSEE